MEVCYDGVAELFGVLDPLVNRVTNIEEVTHSDLFDSENQHELFSISDGMTELFPSHNQNREDLYNGVPHLSDISEDVEAKLSILIFKVLLAKII